MQQHHPHHPAPQQAGEPADERAGQRDAEPERDGQPDDHPQREQAADDLQVAVGEQVLRVAARVGLVLAAEHPADVGVREPAHRPSPPGGLIDVRAVRVAGAVRERVVLAMRGDPFDHRPLHRGRPQHRQHRPDRARRLEAAMREQPVEADRHAQPRERVRDRQHDQVLPAQRFPPGRPARAHQRQRRQPEDHHAHDPLGRLVGDRHRLWRRRGGDTWDMGDLRVSGNSEVRWCCHP